MTNIFKRLFCPLQKNNCYLKGLLIQTQTCFGDTENIECSEHTY